MTNFKKIAAFGTAVAAAAFIATPAAAQQATNSDGKAKARIVKPLTLTITSNDTLDFGTIVQPATGTGNATVSIAASAAGTVGGGCGTGFTCSGAVAAAIDYNVTGTQGQVVEVSIPSSVTITHTNGTDTLSVALSTSLSNADADAAYEATLPNSGAAGLDFYVGGSLTVAHDDLDGVYEGSFDVTADYE